MRKSLGVAFLGMALLAGCRSQEDSDDYLKKQAKDAMRFNLNAPSTARIRANSVVTEGGRKIVCGAVEAMDGSGSMVGPVDYSYDVASKVLTIGADGIAKFSHGPLPAPCVVHAPPDQNASNAASDEALLRNLGMYNELGSDAPR